MDIDPIMQNAYWLRNYAQRMTRKECLYMAIPTDSELEPFHDCDALSRRMLVSVLMALVFDVETAERSHVRLLFTLAEIDVLYAARLSCLYHRVLMDRKPNSCVVHARTQPGN